MERVEVGIIGCGTVSGAYIEGIRRFEFVELVACADLIPERASEKAEQYNIPRAYQVDNLLADPDIKIVINLTIPQAHAEVSMAACRAGKHVFTEKPLATTRQDGLRLLATAKENSVIIGCAPDTFYGPGIQICRRVIDAGWIGEPIAATAFKISHGPEAWHPNPESFYQPGSGPLFDYGPYYLSTLVFLLGPMAKVAALGKISQHQRVISAGIRRGEVIDVSTNTHVSGSIEFENGVITALVTTFDVWHANLPQIEIYGTKGSIRVPDPNFYNGPVFLRREADSQWIQLNSVDSIESLRGIGVADLARAILDDRPICVTGELGFHVLDGLLALEDSVQKGRHCQIRSRCTQPAPLTEGWLPGVTVAPLIVPPPPKVANLTKLKRLIKGVLLDCMS